MKWKEVFDYFEYHSRPERHSIADEIKASNFEQALITMREAHRANDEVTDADIAKLPLTPHMKEIVAGLEFMPRRHSSLRSELLDVYGIGPEEAKRLEDRKDVRSLKDLCKPEVWKTLEEATQKWLSNAPAEQVPRSELEDKLIPIFRKAAQKVGVDMRAVGSYRRKAKYSADLDVLLVAGSEKKAKSAISKVLKELKDHVIVFAQGPRMAHLLLKTSGNPSKKTVRVDLYSCTKEDEPTMLLWTTGPEKFNVLLRRQADKLGYELNQYGLFKNGKEIPIKSEKDVFEKLKTPYVPPEKRGIPKSARTGTKP